MNTERPGTPVHQRPTKQAQARTTHRGEREREMLDDDALYSTRIPNTVRRYDTEQPEQQVRARPRFDVDVHQDYQLGTRIPARRSRVAPPPTPRRPTTQAPPTSKQQHAAQVKLPRLHWLVYVGVTMAALIAAWVIIGVIVNAYVMVSNNLTYGYPRTYQCDAVVGHADSAASPSHFLALNLHNHLEVIELPGGDASQTKIYFGPTLVGEGDDLLPVTLTFQDVTGDGKPDMLMHFGGQTAVWINTGSAFRLATPSDHVSR